MESRNLELGWRKYDLSKFNREKNTWNITWELILEIRIMEMRCKCLGRVWGVPSLFRNFLGIFLCMEMSFPLLCVHFSGVPSVFSSAEWLTCGAGLWGSACWYCAMRGVLTAL